MLKIKLGELIMFIPKRIIFEKDSLEYDMAKKYLLSLKTTRMLKLSILLPLNLNTTFQVKNYFLSIGKVRKL